LKCRIKTGLFIISYSALEADPVIKDHVVVMHAC